MECPECKHDIYSIYDDVLNGKTSKFCKITNFHSDFSLEAINPHSWDVECKCPKCGTEWVFSDSDY